MDRSKLSTGKPAEQPLESLPPKEISLKVDQWRILLHHVAWRVGCALAFSVLLLIVIFLFSARGSLSSVEKRAFNALAILCSSLVSLALGSLLEFLGNMARWSLLVGRKNKPVDVDLTLGIAKPTGAFRLLWHHTVRHRRWTAVTGKVAVYLVVNIALRLSVALVGLTYNLNELPEIEYPTMVTDWAAAHEFYLPKSDAEFFTWSNISGIMDHLNEWATVGLLVAPTEFIETNMSTYTLEDSGGYGLNRKVEGRIVTYSYIPREHYGLETKASQDRTIYSSSTCIGGFIIDEDVYIDGEINNTIRGPYLFSDIPKPLQVDPRDTLWMAAPGGTNFSNPSACLTSGESHPPFLRGHAGKLIRPFQVLYNNFSGGPEGLFYECWTCLSGQNGAPGVETEMLTLPPEWSTYYSSFLLLVGSYAGSREINSRNGTSIQRYPGGSTFGFAAGLANGTLGNGQRYIPPESELSAAHLTARVPLLAMVGGEIKLPKRTHDPDALEKQYVNTVLEVKWQRAIAAVLAILAAQLLVIIATFALCRRVLLPDYNSFFSIARLLKTATGRLGGRSVDSGFELSRQWEGVGMRYGTRELADETREVDLWDDVVGEFPDGQYR